MTSKKSDSTPIDAEQWYSDSQRFPVIDREDDGWYYGEILQWITLEPEINHTAYRVYAVMYSMRIRGRAPRRVLSIEDIRQLVPGVNGKLMSKSTLVDALKVLERYELVTNPHKETRSRRSYDTATGKFVRVAEPVWTLASKAPSWFKGWRNVWDKLDAIQASRQLAGQPQSQNSGTGDPGAPDEEGAGGGHTQNSDVTDQYPVSGTQNSVPPTPSDQQKAAPPISSSTMYPTNQPDGQGTSGLSGGTEVGRSVGRGKGGPTPGALLLASLPQGPGKTFIKRLARTVDELLKAGWTAEQLRARWCADTGPVTSPLGSLQWRITEDTPASPPPRMSGRSGAVAGENPAAKVERLVKKGPEGAREAARLLGMGDWNEPERGNQPAQVYLLETRPAAAREFIDEHRERLLSVLGS